MRPTCAPPTLLACLLLALPSGAHAASAPPGEPSPQDEKANAARAWTVGFPVTRGIELPDLDGKSHVLIPADRPTKDVPEPVRVFVFWSLRDPVARTYEPRLTALRDAYADRGVEFYLIDSNHDEIVAGRGDPLEKLRAFRKETKLTLPLLIDRDNKVADGFQALTSNHAFVVDPQRYVRYAGGIDNDPRGTLDPRQRQEWLRGAIDAARAGGSPEQAITRPTGRRIKRAPVRDAPAASGKERGASRGAEKGR